jgi:uncharacterized protein (DUF433 family)
MSLISRNKQIMSGAYCIRGRRLPVYLIRDNARIHGIKWCMEKWEITRAQVRACLNFRRQQGR